MNDNSFFFWLGVIANFCQLESYQMLLKEANNDDIMIFLKDQDDNYLKKIIEQNEEIISLLKGGKSSA